MSTPTIHLPDAARVDLSGVTERAGDAVSTGIEKVQDLAVAAFDLAGELASAAAERIPDLPEKAITLAGAAIPALRPAPKRSKKPFDPRRRAARRPGRRLVAAPPAQRRRRGAVPLVGRPLRGGGLGRLVAPRCRRRPVVTGRRQRRAQSSSGACPRRRICSKLRRSRRETCIWEIPMRSAISLWLSSS